MKSVLFLMAIAISSAVSKDIGGVSVSERDEHAHKMCVMCEGMMGQGYRHMRGHCDCCEMMSTGDKHCMKKVTREQMEERSGASLDRHVGSICVNCPEKFRHPRGHCECCEERREMANIMCMMKMDGDQEMHMHGEHHE
jgi:hypothetical protein